MNSRNKWEHKFGEEADNVIKKELLESILLYLEEKYNFTFEDDKINIIE